MKQSGHILDQQMDEDLLDLSTSLSARLERLIRNSLLMLVILTVLAFGTVEYWSIALFGLFVIILFLLWGGLEACRAQSRLTFPVILAPLLFGILYGLMQASKRVDSVGRHWALSMDPEATLLVVEVMALLLLAGLMFANLFRTRHRLILLRNFYVIFGLLYSLFALINHFTWNGRYFWVIEPSVDPSHPFGSFVNHNHFAGLVEMIAPIPLALILTRTVRGEIALLNGLAAAVMGMATILSLSRGGMISLISGLMFVVFLGLRPSRMSGKSYGQSGRPTDFSGRWGSFPLAFSRFVAVMVIFVVLAVGILWVGADAVIQRLDLDQRALAGSTSGTTGPDGTVATLHQSRGFIWEDTLRMIRANWLTGIGLGAYQTVYPLYSKRDRFHLVGQAHNDYLQVMADGGIILSILAVLYLGLLLRYGIRAIDHPDPGLSSLAIGCAGGIVSILVHSLFDFNLQIVSNSLVFITLSIVLWRIGYSAINKRVSPGLMAMTKSVNAHSANQMEMEV
jgi:O-antigen ligase